MGDKMTGTRRDNCSIVQLIDAGPILFDCRIKYIAKTNNIPIAIPSNHSRRLFHWLVSENDLMIANMPPAIENTTMKEDVLQFNLSAIL
jgi:hypothetical protein